MKIDQSLIAEATAKALDRRSFLRRTGGAAALLAGASMLGSRTAEAAPTATDVAVLNFALNLEYLEAEFYVYAVTGQSITAQGAGIGGAGTPGETIIKANPKVPFVTPAFQAYAEEVSADELAHVNFLRGALGSAKVAKPKLDLLNSFNTLAKAAGLGDTFDPFASEVNFLLGAFIFEDVGVTAYKGAAALLGDKGVLTAAAGILAAESYHAGIIRTVLYALSTQPGGESIIPTVQAISDVRDSLDVYANGKNLNTDFGISDGKGGSNLFPSDKNAIAYSRTTRQVLNIVYGSVDTNHGLFYPRGMNGAITK